MFRKLLIANRGEIACRIMRTAQRLGIRTVAVYSDADAGALACADGGRGRAARAPRRPRESYLDIDTVIAAADATGAEAIHPGYGFLSENARFAVACARPASTFVGPPATAIHAMGSKIAKQGADGTARVPLVPGYHGDDQADSASDRRGRRASAIPVLIKAVGRRRRQGHAPRRRAEPNSPTR